MCHIPGQWAGTSNPIRWGVIWCLKISQVVEIGLGITIRMNKEWIGFFLRQLDLDSEYFLRCAKEQNFLISMISWLSFSRAILRVHMRVQDLFSGEFSRTKTTFIIFDLEMNGAIVAVVPPSPLFQQLLAGPTIGRWVLRVWNEEPYTNEERKRQAP
jgi:hypothetical protein